MGYLHIENLYKAQDILLFRECYALEKVHGTAAISKKAAGMFHARLRAMVGSPP